MKVIVLGAGLVGGPMAIDLAADDRFLVTAADNSRTALDDLAHQSSIETVEIDLSRPEDVTGLVANYDLVVDAVPGFMGYRTLEAIIRAGRHVVDIAFFPEDPFNLDELAKKNDAIAVTDCGVFPGMGSALIGRAARRLDSIERVLIYVGGLPEVRTWPWEYKAVFSPVDVIEEYMRPARYIDNGVEVTRPALSDPELVDFPGVGTLEAFNTDGLRTLLQTIDAPFMKEKTLRYPGHVEKMAVLRESGFFSAEPVTLQGREVRPIDLTARLLFPMWKLQPGEGDITILKILIEGGVDGRKQRVVYDMLDRFDRDSNTTSMARTTGYTATATVRMIADGLYARTGISPPEYLGQVPGCVQYLLDRLAERGVIYEEHIELLDG